MIAHQLAANGAQRFLNGRNLHEDVRAIALILDEPLQTPHLPLNAAEALQIRRLDFRVDSQRFAALRVCAAAAGGGPDGHPTVSRGHKTSAKSKSGSFLLYPPPLCQERGYAGSCSPRGMLFALAGRNATPRGRILQGTKTN